MALGCRASRVEFGHMEIRKILEVVEFIYVVISTFFCLGVFSFLGITELDIFIVLSFVDIEPGLKRISKLLIFPGPIYMVLNFISEFGF